VTADYRHSDRISIRSPARRTGEPDASQAEQGGGSLRAEWVRDSGEPGWDRGSDELGLAGRARAARLRYLSSQAALLAGCEASRSKGGEPEEPPPMIHAAKAARRPVALASAA
jgi:hypothetical protein